MNSYEAQLAAIDRAWYVQTASHVVIIALLLTFALFALWQLPWTAAERHQFEEAWHGRVVAAPERPTPAAMLTTAWRALRSYVLQVGMVEPADR